MTVLYTARYVGPDGIGVAGICVGNGQIIGFDGADGRYRGHYVESDGRIRGTIILSSKDQWPLVSGGTIEAGEEIVIVFDWPAQFADGEPQPLYLQSKKIDVTMQKVGEIV